MSYRKHKISRIGALKRDYFLDAKESVEYGIVDGVLESFHELK
jgi:ATP-dependent protease ClpP protease subunit